MNLTKSAIGNLINRYKAVLKKCSLMNVFGSLAIAGMLVASVGVGVGVASATGAAESGATQEIIPNDGVVSGKTYKDKIATAGDNGAVFNVTASTDLTITNSNFMNNTTTRDSNKSGVAAGGYGGAIYFDASGHKLKISNSTFNGNTSAYHGGAIYIKNGTADFDNVKFINNKATPPKGEYDKYTYGGALYTTNGVIVNITGGEFTGNTIDSKYASGGAIRTNLDAGLLTITNTTFTDNKAIDSGEYGESSGGAIAVFADLKITGATFTNNQTNGLAVPDTFADDMGGGAIFLGAVTETSITDTKFIGNKSLRGRAGAISTRHSGVATQIDAFLDITGSIFTENIAHTTGGAIDNFFYQSKGDNHSEFVFVGDSDFIRNEAASGGAIYNHGEQDTGGKKAKIYIENSTFTGNTADALTETELTDLDGHFSAATGYGGALYNANLMTIAVTDNKNITNIGNTATESGGFLYNVGNAVKNGSGEAETVADVITTFDIGTGATLTIGTEGQEISENNNNLDSISSDHSTGNELIKEGAGALTVYGDTSGYTGTITVSAGTLNLTNGFGTYSEGVKALANDVAGAIALETLAVSTLTVAEDATANIGNLDITFAHGAIEAGVKGTEAGTVVTVANGGKFTAGKVTVDSETYTNDDGTRAGDITTTGWGKFDIGDTADASIDSLTITNGKFEKAGDGELVFGNLIVTADGTYSNVGTTTINGEADFQANAVVTGTYNLNGTTDIAETLDVKAGTVNNNSLLNVKGLATLNDSGAVFNNTKTANFAAGLTITDGTYTNTSGTTTVTGTTTLVNSEKINITGGTFTTTKLDVGTGTGSVTVGGGSTTATLTIKGIAAGDLVTDATKSIAVNNLGTVIVDSTVVLTDVFAKTDNIAVDTFNVAAGGTLRVNGLASIEKGNITTIKASLMNDNSKGLLDLGTTTITGLVGEVTNEADYADATGISSDELKTATVTVDKDTAIGNTGISGGFGNLELDEALDNEEKVQVDGTLHLTGNDNKLIAVAGSAGDVAADVNVKDGSALTIGNENAISGTLGEISLENDESTFSAIGGNQNKTSFEVSHITGKGKVVVSNVTLETGNITGASLAVSGSTMNTGTINTDSLVLNGGTVNAACDINTGDISSGSSDVEVIGGRSVINAKIDTATDGNVRVGQTANDTNANASTTYTDASSVAISLANLTINAGRDVIIGKETASAVSFTGANNLVINAGVGSLQDTKFPLGVGEGSVYIKSNADLDFANGTSITAYKNINISSNATYSATGGKVTAGTTGQNITSAGGDLILNAIHGDIEVGTVGMVSGFTGTDASIQLSAGNSIEMGAFTGIGVNDKIYADIITANAKIDLSKGGNIIATGDTMSTITGLLELGADARGNFNFVDLVAGATVADGSTLNIDKLQVEGGANQKIAATDGGFVRVGEINSTSTNQILFTADETSILSFGTMSKETLTPYLGVKANGFEATSILAINKSLSLSHIDGISIGASASATAGEGNIGDNTLIVADLSSLGGKPLITSDGGAININKGAGLFLITGQDTVAGKKIQLTKGVTTEIGTGSETLAYAGVDSILYKLTVNDVTIGTDENLYATLRAESASVINEKLGNTLDSGVLGILTSMANGGISDHNGGGAKFLTNVTKNPSREAGTAVQSAADVTAAAASPQMAMAISGGASSITTTRTSFSAPTASADGTAVAMNEDGSVQLSGMAAEQGMSNGVGIWFMPMYRNQSVYGYESGGLDSGYNSSFGGAVMGVDYTINNDFRFGASFNVGTGHSESTGDLNDTTNDFNYWGLGLYAGYQINNIGLTADVSYTTNYSEIEQYQSSALGGDLDGDINTYTLAAGLRAEYKIETDMIDIIPHIGVRITSMNSESYDMSNNLGNVIEADALDATIWTFPIGVTFSKDIETSSGWNVQTQLDLSVIPAAGDVEVDQDIRFTGVSQKATMTSDVMDYISYGGGIGFTMGKDNILLGLNYNLQLSEHMTDHGVQATLRYEF